MPAGLTSETCDFPLVTSHEPKTQREKSSGNYFSKRQEPKICASISWLFCPCGFQINDIRALFRRDALLLLTGRRGFLPAFRFLVFDFAFFAFFAIDRLLVVVDGRHLRGRFGRWNLVTAATDPITCRSACSLPGEPIELAAARWRRPDQFACGIATAATTRCPSSPDLDRASSPSRRHGDERFAGWYNYP
jgi:hypothetical protein